MAKITGQRNGGVAAKMKNGKAMCWHQHGGQRNQPSAGVALRGIYGRQTHENERKCYGIKQYGQQTSK